MGACLLCGGSTASCAMRSWSWARALEKEAKTVAVFLAPPEMSFAELLGSMMEILSVSLYMKVFTWLCITVSLVSTA